MIKFDIPPWRKKLIEDAHKRRDKLINQSSKETEAVLKNAIAYIIDNDILFKKFTSPPLHELDIVFDRFYRNVVTEAWWTCDEEKRKMKGKKRLARMPFGMPKYLPGLEKLFRDSKLWPKVMKRSQMLVDKLRGSYLKKLFKLYSEIVPMMREGEMQPDEAKSYLMKGWQASKSRVELIFRTETTTYFGKTKVAYFGGDDEIIGFLFDSVRDTARTDICRSRHGMIYRKDHTGQDSIAYNTPAMHYQCRSDLIALANTPENVKMIKDINRDPAKNRSKIVDLMPGWR
jgi:SPP1 gp7 family putative phage head morphogenesis protein